MRIAALLTSFNPFVEGTFIAIKTASDSTTRSFPSFNLEGVEDPRPSYAAVAFDFVVLSFDPLGHLVSRQSRLDSFCFHQTFNFVYYKLKFNSFKLYVLKLNFKYKTLLNFKTHSYFHGGFFSK